MITPIGGEHASGGFVIDAKDSQLLVEVVHSFEIEPGVKVAINLTNLEHQAELMAVLAIRDKKTAHFIISPGARINLAHVEPRYPGYAHTVFTEIDRKHERCEIIDFSMSGMALRVEKPQNVGQTASVVIGFEGGVMCLKAVVVYCAADPSSPNRNRIGLRLADNNRVERGKWVRFISWKAVADPSVTWPSQRLTGIG